MPLSLSPFSTTLSSTPASISTPPLLVPTYAQLPLLPLPKLTNIRRSERWTADAGMASESAPDASAFPDTRRRRTVSAIMSATPKGSAPSTSSKRPGWPPSVRMVRRERFIVRVRAGIWWGLCRNRIRPWPIAPHSWCGCSVSGRSRRKPRTAACGSTASVRCRLSCGCCGRAFLWRCLCGRSCALRALSGAGGCGERRRRRADSPGMRTPARWSRCP